MAFSPPDVSFIKSELCCAVSWVSRPVHFVDLELNFQKLGRVEGERHDDDGQDVEPGLPRVQRQHRVAQAEVALQGDGHLSRLWERDHSRHIPLKQGNHPLDD